jgi:hypothetical protein
MIRATIDDIRQDVGYALRLARLNPGPPRCRWRRLAW